MSDLLQLQTPCMRYVGSKRRLGRFFIRHIQRALEVYPNGKYIEPFVGGCNMITQVNHHTKIGYDANKYLIALLHEAKNNPDKLRQSTCISRKAYEYVKAHMDEFQAWYVGAMGFLPTYGCIWMGSYMNDKERGRFVKGINGLLKQNLADIHLINSDYRNIPIGKGNVIYCDPPYIIHNYYGIPFNHEEFYDWVRYASRDNIVFVSEYEMPDDFDCIWQMQIRPQINNNGRLRYEKLFIYRP